MLFEKRNFSPEKRILSILLRHSRFMAPMSPCNSYSPDLAQSTQLSLPQASKAEDYLIADHPENYFSVGIT